MKRLPVTDAAWLLLENRERPMHVAGLQLFSYPKDAPPSFLEDIIEEFRRGTEVKPPFNQRLVRPYGRAGSFHWEKDPDFDMEFHFRPIALPKPGRIRELLSVVSRVHSALLDRHRPLWTCYLIEGIEDDRFAIYTKIHHSVVDGVAAMRLMMSSFSEDPEQRNMPPPWASNETSRKGERADHGGTGDPFTKALAQLRGQFGTIPGVSRALIEQFRNSRTMDAEVIPYQAPKSLLNGKITGSRRFAAQSYSLERMKAVAKAADATLNDVAMSMCSTALRSYLDAQNALPDKPLIAMVPVSVRPKDEPGYGNSIGFVMCNLATHLTDPAARFRLIRESMQAGKDRLKQMSRDEIINYSLLVTTPLLVGQLTGIEGRYRPMFNVTISNVPGPRNPLYWNGARMEGLYPISLLTDGQAINITLMSYVDSMEFGITACRKTLPSVQRILDFLDDALDELEHATGLAAPKKKSVSRRSA